MVIVSPCTVGLTVGLTPSIVISFVLSDVGRNVFWGKTMRNVESGNI